MEIYAVSDVTHYVKAVLDADPRLQDLWVQGEVSNYFLSTAGHAYFTLKDSASQIVCVMFRHQIHARTRLPSNGVAVIVHGRISVYEARGAYQLYVDLVQPEGVGLLYLEFEELRARLEREGLFEPTRKRPLPRFPRLVGVVTSEKGAVLHDIVNVVGRRFPLVELVVIPTLVQGEDAAESICHALRVANDYADVDVIILARGGGSLEDLWPFNEESVARSIYASRVPVVTGIGHETDFTIADFVADLRAPTPSAAAEMVTPDWRECRTRVEELGRDLTRLAGEALDARRQRLSESAAHLRRLSPLAAVDRFRQSVDDLGQRSILAATHRLEIQRERLRSRQLQLQTLNPQEVLERGYSLCSSPLTGSMIRSIKAVAEGDLLRVTVADGKFDGRVEGQPTPI